MAWWEQHNELETMIPGEQSRRSNDIHSQMFVSAQERKRRPLRSRIARGRLAIRNNWPCLLIHAACQKTSVYNHNLAGRKRGCV